MGNGGSTTRELAADEYELLGFDSSKASDKVTVTVQSVADSTKTATFTVKVVARRDADSGSRSGH